MAGVVPFARLPRKAYRPKLENVIRVDLDYLRESVAPASPSEYSDSRDDRLDLSDSDSDNSSSSSYSSYSSASSSSSPHPSSSPSSPQYQPPSYSSLKQFDELDHDRDESQSGNGNGSTVSHSLQKKKKFTFLKLVKGFLRQRRSYVLFQMWRERKANERRSQMLIQLEEKATVLKNKIYNEIEREIDEDQNHQWPPYPSHNATCMGAFDHSSRRLSTFPISFPPTKRKLSPSPCLFLILKRAPLGGAYTVAVVPPRLRHCNDDKMKHLYCPGQSIDLSTLTNSIHANFSFAQPLLDTWDTSSLNISESEFVCASEELC
jgi:hypothetical protein